MCYKKITTLLLFVLLSSCTNINTHNNIKSNPEKIDISDEDLKMVEDILKINE